MFRLIFVCILFSICQQIHAQQKIEWTGFRIVDNDTALVTISLIQNDSVVRGTARYDYKNGRNYMIYNVKGRVIPGDSIYLQDGYIEDKLMPPGCSTYGDYFLKVSDSVGVITGLWQEPGSSPLRKKESASLFMVENSLRPRIDSVLLRHSMRGRADSVVGEFVATGMITIELLDNAEVDGDRVSVYYNDQLVVQKQELKGTPFIVSIAIDETQPVSVLKIVAENEGSVPPNTALVRVKMPDGQESLIARSSFSTNAVILFRIKK